MCQVMKQEARGGEWGPTRTALVPSESMPLMTEQPPTRHHLFDGPLPLNITKVEPKLRAQEPVAGKAGNQP